MLRGRCCKKNGTTKRERNKTTDTASNTRVNEKKEGKKGEKEKKKKKEEEGRGRRRQGRSLTLLLGKEDGLAVDRGYKGKEEEEEEEEEKGSRREGVACWATGASGMAFVWILERLSCLIRYGLEIRPPRADSGEGSSYKTG